jgi:hypothetical protein
MENEFYNQRRDPSQKNERREECIEGGGQFTIFKENKCPRKMIQIKMFHSKILKGCQNNRCAQQDDGRFPIFPAEEPIGADERFESIHAALFLS